MARAFDISRRPTRRSTPSHSHTPAPRHRKSGTMGYIFFILFVIVVIFILSSFTNTPANNSSTKSNNTSPTPTPTINPSGITASPTPTKNTDIKIQILNGSGITSVSNDITKILQAKGFKVDSSSDAQFKYSQTYIYYRPNSETQAQAISEALKSYKPTLSLSQVDNLFDILIIVGKDNLPQN